MEIYLHQDGERTGPFTLEDVQGWLEGGQLTVSDAAWFEGCEDWVTVQDVPGFCQKLTQLEKAAGRMPDGWKYTLPTEAQWEYACRAGTTTAYAFGNTMTAKQANFDKKVSKTTSVGKYPANAWGFHDMHGNVREWCLDWHEAFAKVSVRDPQGPVVGSNRVLRGGSWRSYGGDLRSATRYRSTPDSRNNRLGFRLSLQTETE